MTTKIVNVLLASLIGLTIAASLARAQRPTESTAAAVKAQGDAAWRGGLHAQAKAAGGHYLTISDWETELQYRGLPDLMKAAEVVVVGDIVENASHLSKSGEYITTDYRVLVHEVFKGDLLPHTNIVFQVKGGKVVFDDGSTAQMETRGFVRPNTGERVVIFANRFDDNDEWMPPALLEYAQGAPIFRSAAANRGVIGLPEKDTDKVKVKALSARDTLARDTRQTDRRSFVAELRRAAAEERASKRY